MVPIKNITIKGSARYWIDASVAAAPTAIHVTTGMTIQKVMNPMVPMIAPVSAPHRMAHRTDSKPGMFGVNWDELRGARIFGANVFSSFVQELYLSD